MAPQDEKSDNMPSVSKPNTKLREFTPLELMHMHQDIKSLTSLMTQLQQANATLETKMVEEVAILTTKVQKDKAAMEKQMKKQMEDEVASLTTRIKTLEKANNILNTELHAANIKLNTVEQRDRNYSARFYGFRPHGKSRNQSNNNIHTLVSVYNTFIVPAFECAIEAGLIDHTPHFLVVCDIGHPLPSRTKGCPPIQFRFTTRLFREIFFLFATDVIETFNRKHRAFVSAGRDLSEANRHVMSLLNDEANMEKYWLAGTDVRYKKKDQPPRRVTNPYGNKIEELHLTPKGLHFFNPHKPSRKEDRDKNPLISDPSTHPTNAAASNRQAEIEIQDQDENN